MCGITGFFNNIGIEKNHDLLLKMTNSLAHRGPDNYGTFIDDFAALGHRRLSVIDLENGNQPMTDDENSVIIVYNGEIYNFLELRKELEEENFSFKTNSDTEVLIYAYKYWGENFVSKLNGMFSFAIYDKKKKALFLYRDRLGIKPLYYTFLNNTVIFASEPKALFFFPITKKINMKVLSNYLSTHQINFSEETLFENIFLLKPAHFLKIDTNGKKLIKYWKLPFYDNDKGEEYYLEQVRESLKNSTKMRLISDVGLGAFLSGGVDSSILVSIINETVNKKLKTFSIGFSKENYNEFKYSDLINERYNINHLNTVLDESEYFTLNEELIKYKDFPLNVPNEVLIYKLSKILKEHITVVLSGEGSDEFFGGYGLFLRSVHDYCKLFLLNKCPDFFTDNVKAFLSDSLQRQYKSLDFSSLQEFVYKIYTVFSFEEKQYLFNEDILKNLENDDFIIDYFDEILNLCEKESYYDKFLYFLEFYHLEGLLLRLDNATMAASVEARVPYIDHNLAELSFNMPFKYKIKWKNENNQIDAYVSNAREISEKFDITKYILKKAFDNELPDVIAKRNKFSFPVPLNEWFEKDFKNYLNMVFAKHTVFYDIFKKDNVMDFIHEPMYGKNGLKVWMLLNLKLWIDNFF